MAHLERLSLIIPTTLPIVLFLLHHNAIVLEVFFNAAGHFWWVTLRVWCLSLLLLLVTGVYPWLMIILRIRLTVIFVIVILITALWLLRPIPLLLLLLSWVVLISTSTTTLFVSEGLLIAEGLVIVGGLSLLLPQHCLCLLTLLLVWLLLLLWWFFTWLIGTRFISKTRLFLLSWYNRRFLAKLFLL